MKRGLFIIVCILVFIVSFIGSALFKVTYTPSWAKNYTVDNFEEVGKVYNDISYGNKESNTFDIYVPNDNSKESYGLVVYLHGGGFTSGDKSDDEDMLEWLCSLGYVSVGINYTLRTDDNEESVYLQSLEIKSAMSSIVKEASNLGYNITEMAIGGGSAGGTLAMLNAYRDKDESPVPVKLLFEAVGPSSFIRSDWTSYGLDQNVESAAYLFSVMLGSEVSVDVIDTDAYDELIKPISAYMWIDEDTVPSVIAYGTYDKVCPFKSASHLVETLQNNGIDYQYFEATHSGHALQNDNDVYCDYLDTVIEYLDKYMPVED